MDIPAATGGVFEELPHLIDEEDQAGAAVVAGDPRGPGCQSFTVSALERLGGVDGFSEGGTQNRFGIVAATYNGSDAPRRLA